MELKNLEIIDNTNEGLGVAKSEEGIVFVKGGLVGDIVNVEITQKKKIKKSLSIQTIQMMKSSILSTLIKKKKKNLKKKLKKIMSTMI